MTAGQQLALFAPPLHIAILKVCVCVGHFLQNGLGRRSRDVLPRTLSVRHQADARIVEMFAAPSPLKCPFPIYDPRVRVNISQLEDLRLVSVFMCKGKCILYVARRKLNEAKAAQRHLNSGGVNKHSTHRYLWFASWQSSSSSSSSQLLRESELFSSTSSDQILRRYFYSALIHTSPVLISSRRLRPPLPLCFPSFFGPFISSFSSPLPLLSLWLFPPILSRELHTQSSGKPLLWLFLKWRTTDAVRTGGKSADC